MHAFSLHAQSSYRMQVHLQSQGLQASRHERAYMGYVRADVLRLIWYGGSVSSIACRYIYDYRACGRCGTSVRHLSMGMLYLPWLLSVCLCMQVHLQPQGLRVLRQQQRAHMDHVCADVLRLRGVPAAAEGHHLGQQAHQGPVCCQGQQGQPISLPSSGTSLDVPTVLAESMRDFNIRLQGSIVEDAHCCLYI